SASTFSKPWDSSNWENRSFCRKNPIPCDPRLAGVFSLIKKAPWSGAFFWSGLTFLLDLLLRLDVMPQEIGQSAPQTGGAEQKHDPRRNAHHAFPPSCRNLVKYRAPIRMIPNTLHPKASSPL